MSNGDIFSVVTVCRNEEKNIRKTCESICSQMFRDFEWIVIDGASTDGTLDILTEYKDRISVLVSEPDSGIYNAMNKGISHASGQYLVFLNGGDRFTDCDVLQVVTDAPQKDIIYGDLVFARENGDREEKRFPDVLSRHYLLKNMMPHQAAYIRRELFQKYGKYDESYIIAGDYELFVRLLYVEQASCFHISRPLAIFKEDGISSSPEKRYLRKTENHRIRKTYFPMYRYSWKGLRQELRNLTVR